MSLHKATPAELFDKALAGNLYASSILIERFRPLALKVAERFVQRFPQQSSHLDDLRNQALLRLTLLCTYPKTKPEYFSGGWLSIELWQSLRDYADGLEIGPKSATHRKRAERGRKLSVASEDNAKLKQSGSKTRICTCCLEPHETTDWYVVDEGERHPLNWQFECREAHEARIPRETSESFAGNAEVVRSQPADDWQESILELCDCDQERQYVTLRVAGHKKLEIADRLNMTPKAIARISKRLARRYHELCDDPQALALGA